MLCNTAVWLINYQEDFSGRQKSWGESSCLFLVTLGIVRSLQGNDSTLAWHWGICRSIQGTDSTLVWHWEICRLIQGKDSSLVWHWGICRSIQGTDSTLVWHCGIHAWPVVTCQSSLAVLPSFYLEMSDIIGPPILSARY